LSAMSRLTAAILTKAIWPQRQGDGFRKCSTYPARYKAA
jgi:hypothetical protein